MALSRLSSGQVALAVCVLAMLMITSVGAAADDQCTSNGFLCPNCNGTVVSDCLKCDDYLNTDYVNKICFQRSLFGPTETDHSNHDHYYDFLWNDIVGTFVWFIAAGVATACGVGGGGIYVPLGMLLLRFAPKPASGLSQASIFGASLGGLVLNLRNQHPNTKIRDDVGRTQTLDGEGKVIPIEASTMQMDSIEKSYADRGGKFYTRPLIDYDMALFLAPMEMAGAVLGVLIQKILPNWLYLFLAAIILGFTAFKTFNKFRAAHEKEKQDRLKQQEMNEKDASVAASMNVLKDENVVNVDGEANGEEKPTSTNYTNGSSNKMNMSSEMLHDENHQEKVEIEEDETSRLRRQFLEEDARQFPREKLLVLLLLWMGLILLTFLKGGKGVESIIGIDCESPWFSVLIVCQFLWTLGFALVFGLKLPKRVQARKDVGYPFQPTDVMWDNSKLRFYAAFTFVAGIVAGLIGIGGGMVLGPLMLIMGIHPRVSSATTATMIVLTSSSVAVLFVTAGLVPWAYAVYFFAICFCGAYLGKKYIDGYIKKSGRASILVCILATIIALATVGCIVIALTNLARKEWCFDGFQPFCEVDDDDDKDCASRRMLSVLQAATAALTGQQPLFQLRGGY
eukprot:CAMPEP_0168727666 /NCGR_PEP_ID=MMETSP0724-20121128/5292_1 /TAXON_ID=265536 /ORGANISM="Amphiprora sp., Strain CCMP467" /LENGTH=623 /DNA_ID=CAMNT_0008774499 /DNA_START=52 /DNA_END=1923 /DNA_ORIENTATION=+